MIKEKYIDQYGIDSLRNLKEAVSCGMDAFVTVNQSMVEDKEELEENFGIKIIILGEGK